MSRLRRLQEPWPPETKPPSCIHCGEPVLPTDESGHINTPAGTGIHKECAIRMTVGSVAHQQRRCPCFGGTQDDPPGMTRREAAKAAQRLFEATHAEKN